MTSLEKMIFEHLFISGGEPFITGGTVRDKLLGVPGRDTDVVVFGMDENMLFNELGYFGQVLTYGKSFRVYQVRGIDVEFSLPRNRESPEKVNLEQRLRRDAEGRDFTVNALYMNPLSEDINDPLGGLEDLKMKRLRMTTRRTFAEDPLRVLRAVQLSARMGFSVEDKTMESMSRISLKSVAHERVYEELNKWLLGSDPAKGWQLMSKTGHIPATCQIVEEYLPVIADILTYAASLRNHSTNPLQWMWGVLLSTCMLAKIQHSQETDQEKNLTHIIHQFNQLSHHHDHTQFISEMLWGVKNFKCYAVRKADVVRLSLGVNLDELMLTITALSPFWRYVGREAEVHQAKYRIKQLRPLEPIVPMVKGIDLKEWGFKEGKAMGTLLEAAFQMQLEGITKKQMETYFKKYQKVLQNIGH